MLKILPKAYLCNDAGSFAANTLLVRLPAIARRMLAENRFPERVVRKVEYLLEEMRSGQVSPIEDPGAPDTAAWTEYLRPHLGKPWSALSFWFCENYFYRRILAATEYFQPGLEFGLDPYAEQKRLGLTTSRDPLVSLAWRLEEWHRMPLERALGEVLESNLWGNRADLSLWPAGAEDTLSNDRLHQAAEFLIVNHLENLVAFLVQLRGGRVDFLIDNAGFELACDLALADLLLTKGVADEVRFHLKFHPTFVSDALEEDTRGTALFWGDLGDPTSQMLSRRLVKWLDEGRLVLHRNLFWNSPLLGWEIPHSLRDELQQADLCISKGDANFRRLLGDLHWPETTPFAEIVACFPTRLATLRVDKSELAVGLAPGQAERLDALESDWRFNGRWGMIQFA